MIAQAGPDQVAQTGEAEEGGAPAAEGDAQAGELGEGPRQEGRLGVEPEAEAVAQAEGERVGVLQDAGKLDAGQVAADLEAQDGCLHVAADGARQARVAAGERHRGRRAAAELVRDRGAGHREHAPAERGRQLGGEDLGHAEIAFRLEPLRGAHDRGRRVARAQGLRERARDLPDDFRRDGDQDDAGSGQRLGQILGDREAARQRHARKIFRVEVLPADLARDVGLDRPQHDVAAPARADPGNAAREDDGQGGPEVPGAEDRDSHARQARLRAKGARDRRVL